MEPNKNSSLLLQYGGILWFMSMLLGALVWFAKNAIFTVRQLISSPQSVSFDKGAFYMLGVGVVLGALTTAMILEVWKKEPLSERTTRRIVRTALFGVAITFLLPQVVHYPISHYLTERGYEVCHKASYQWMLYRKIVFVNDLETCSQVSDKIK